MVWDKPADNKLNDFEKRNRGIHNRAKFKSLTDLPAAVTVIIPSSMRGTSTTFCFPGRVRDPRPSVNN